MILSTRRNVNWKNIFESHMESNPTTLRDLVDALTTELLETLFINFLSYHKGLIGTIKQILLAVVYNKLCQIKKKMISV